MSNVTRSHVVVIQMYLIFGLIFLFLIRITNEVGGGWSVEVLVKIGQQIRWFFNCGHRIVSYRTVNQSRHHKYSNNCIKIIMCCFVCKNYMSPVCEVSMIFITSAFRKSSMFPIFKFTERDRKRRGTGEMICRKLNLRSFSAPLGLV